MTLLEVQEKLEIRGEDHVKTEFRFMRSLTKDLSDQRLEEPTYIPEPSEEVWPSQYLGIGLPSSRIIKQ